MSLPRQDSILSGANVCQHKSAVLWNHKVQFLNIVPSEGIHMEFESIKSFNGFFMVFLLIATHLSYDKDRYGYYKEDLRSEFEILGFI